MRQLSGANFRAATPPATNRPYFEMLESEGKDERVDSIVACVERDRAGQLLKQLPILALFAQGHTSEFVMQGLRLLSYAPRVSRVE